MRLTSHNGRADSSGRHNDRNFDLSKAPHILQEKVKDNRYFTYNGEMDKTFAEIEKSYYKEHFGDYIRYQNKKNKEHRHGNRIRTIDQYHSSRNTRPEDKIIQIGDKDNHIEGDLLWEVALEYQSRFDKMFGEHCRILDMALHMDEETPHIHIRRVWSYMDENGFEKVGQTRALDALGILSRDPAGPEGKLNNAKVTFSAIDRDLLMEICREKGIELEEEPKQKRRHLSTPEYKKMSEELEELERERGMIRQELQEMREELKDNEKDLNDLADQMEKFLQNQIFRHMYDEQIAEAKKKSSARRMAALAEIYNAEAQKVIREQNFENLLGNPEIEKKNEKIRKLSHKVEILSNFIVDKKLEEDFNDYAKQQRNNIKERGSSN